MDGMYLRGAGILTEAERGAASDETRVQYFGPEHPDTLTSMNDLASTYLNPGRWMAGREAVCANDADNEDSTQA